MFSIDLAKQKIAHAVGESLGVSVDADWVEFSNPKAGSHLALPCFRFAKQAGGSPPEVASRIAQTLQVEGVSKVEAAGPYLNFWVEATSLAQGVLDARSGALDDREPNGQTAVIEFLSPNLAKPVSIGHFRNVLQGKALVRMYKNSGYNVITDNHIGDWGTVFGMWVVGFQNFSSDEKLAEGGVEELGRMYVEMRKALKEEESTEQTVLADQVQEWLLKLEAKDAEAWEYHKRFSEISLASITDQMAELDIVFDHNYGESFFVERGKQMVGELVESGQAIRNEDGSVVVPLDEYGQETPMLIQKSNGAALYHTSDMATIEFREKTWNPAIVIYVVGAEQQFHFKQLFAANQKIGWSDAELIHHWYGLIEELTDEGKRQKMSSRKNAVYLSDLLEIALTKAREAANDDMSDEDIKRVAYGALTFQEFSASHTSNTLFDWDAMFSLSGFSGPYVQYAAVRISSLLAKNEAGDITKPAEYDWSPHQDILFLLNKYETVIEAAMEEREFHKIAEYAYELARSWNRLYDDVPILKSDEPDRSARLWLAESIGLYLTRALYLLGMKIPGKM